MAYRQPAFMVEHPASTRTLADIIEFPAGRNADAKRALIDFRQNEMSVPTANQSLIQVNFGVNTIATHVVIPAGHNMDGISPTVVSDTNQGFTTALNRGTFPITGSGVLDWELLLPATADDSRYQVNFNTSGLWELGELWIGRKTTLSSAAKVDPDFGDSYLIKRSVLDLNTRNAVTQLSPARRQFQLTVRKVAPGSSDHDILEQVATEGEFRPFWYWPPDDTDPGPFLVELSRPAGKDQDFDVPASKISYTYTIQMTESKG